MAEIRGQRAGKGFSPPVRGSGGVLSPSGVPQIHCGPTKSLENASSGCTCWTQFNIFTEHRWSHAEPLDTTGGTLRLNP